MYIYTIIYIENTYLHINDMTFVMPPHSLQSHLLLKNSCKKKNVFLHICD